ncbi:DNA-binding response regulator, NarL/FixJ family, contains REC and HTH domains [Hymenobacter daecheongensis DSM 21074]|uniref:DNA-binding response regulator, NarL/FixJ family, contains REC and HTH domains n=1 Tax=Hymenobacter daecheongensis DSM 21074 TaxID=1121955 RepID=A0A1M6H475_9BACT|nr:response regulator transcription factor [Hymenobacter daecheongensis]SHJ16963.1 DNA-binding response regulator, NarL/FixJ family, contains REC and HTH domains [Hymenobacter daecheongensis DSM 21074]
MPTPTRVLLYEDNPDLRASLSQLLAGSPDLQVVGALGHCRQAVADVERLAPDVILMDIDMPGMTGIEGLRRIKAVAPQVNVVMLTVFEDNDRVFEAICAGADGYLLKKTSPIRLLDAIGEVRLGGAPMTPGIARQVLRLFPRSKAPVLANEEPVGHLSAREQEVLGLLVEGYSYKMIAADRGISIDTVRSHIKKIYEKLHVRSMTEAVSKALRQGLT